MSQLDSIWKRWEEIAKKVVESKKVQEACWTNEKIESRSCSLAIKEAANAHRTTTEKIANSIFHNQDSLVLHNAKLKISEKFWFSYDQ